MVRLRELNADLRLRLQIAQKESQSPQAAPGKEQPSAEPGAQPTGIVP
jgi:hypothetical protein